MSAQAWIDLAVAAGTLGLAAAAFVQIRQSKAAALLAEEQRIASVQPVLNIEAIAFTKLEQAVAVHVQVHNVGLGPALHMTVELEMSDGTRRDESLALSSHVPVDLPRTLKQGAVATFVIPTGLRLPGLTGRTSALLLIGFDDIAGNRYALEQEYHMDPNGFDLVRRSQWRLLARQGPTARFDFDQVRGGALLLRNN